MKRILWSELLVLYNSAQVKKPETVSLVLDKGVLLSVATEYKGVESPLGVQLILIR
jgi:hypothetical protein